MSRPRLDLRLALAACALIAAPAGLAFERAGAIVVGALPQLDDWAISGADRPLPGDLWAGVQASDLAALLAEAPSTYASLAARDLALRALTTSAPSAPIGDDAVALQARFEALGRMGAAEPLAAMTQGGGAIARDARVQQFGAQADLALGRTDNACRRVRADLGPTPPAFVYRMRAFCFALDKQWPAAELAMDVARENRAAEAWLFSALPVVAGVETRKPAARYGTSLDAAVSRAAGLAPGRDALSQSSPLAILAVARDETAPANLRYGAAVLAARWGLVDGAVARAAIRASIPASTQARAAAAAPRLQPLAAAVRAVETAPSDPAKADAVAAALRAATAPGAFLAVARVFEAELRGLPRPAAPDAAPLFARAALVLGDAKLAASWRALAPTNAPPAATAGLDYAIALAAGDFAAAAAALSDRERLGAPAATVARERALLAALQAPEAPPETPLATALGAAVVRKATGEVALRAAFAAKDGADKLAPGDLAAIVRALTALELGAEARALLLDSAVAGL